MHKQSLRVRPSRTVVAASADVSGRRQVRRRSETGGKSRVPASAAGLALARTRLPARKDGEGLASSRQRCRMRCLGQASKGYTTPLHYPGPFLDSALSTCTAPHPAEISASAPAYGAVEGVFV